MLYYIRTTLHFNIACPGTKHTTLAYNDYSASLADLASLFTFVLSLFQR